jgi:hypothetical protein
MLRAETIPGRDWYLEKLYAAWRAASGEADDAYVAWTVPGDSTHT